MKRYRLHVITALMLAIVFLALSACKKTDSVLKSTEESSDSSSSVIETSRVRHVSLHDVDIEDIPVQVYKASEIYVVPTLKYQGEKLVNGKDYSLDWKDNIIPGQATVEVFGLGTYTGVVKVQFEIVMDDEYCDNASNASVFYFVLDAYKTFLGHLPSREDWIGYTWGLSTQEICVEELITSLIQSVEYQYSGNGGLQTIEKAYNLILGRDMTDDERTLYATKLQETGATPESVLSEQFNMGFFEQACESKGMLSAPLKFSEDELVGILESTFTDTWTTDPVFADYNGDGFLEVVREAEKTDGSSVSRYFAYTDGIHYYTFFEQARLSYGETACWVISNDGGASFAFSRSWTIPEKDGLFYDSGIFQLDRTESEQQFYMNYATFFNPQINTIDVSFFDDDVRVDEAGQDILPQTKTITYLDGIYS